MKTVNNELKNYIEKQILPIYEKNDAAHDINHIKYVIKRSLEFAKSLKDLNLDMVYTIASFHDLAHHLDKDNHEILSAKIFYENKDMKDFFNNEERIIIKEAIEDHRASLEYEPRSIYGKIISSADRTTSIETVLLRTNAYTTTHFPDLDLYKKIERCYNHVLKKYGNNGYAKNYFYDKDYEQFKLDVKNILEDKWLFTKKYLEVNKINDLKEKAKLFAINAHFNQVRKSEPDKPMIIHPLGVGLLLEEYDCDKNIIAAGYLHDVVEDTKYTILDIEKEFNEDIKNLVLSATEIDKSLSWEDRKKHTILETKTLPLRNKLVICADKINNLEDLMIKFQKENKRDFSTFKRGEEKQKWYYTSIYESLIYNEDVNLPIFKRLKDVLDVVFYQKEDLYLKNTIFDDNIDYYNKLKVLHAKKIEIEKLKKLCPLKKPFVIEFLGTPRTGKTSTINNLKDFFKKGGFKINIIEEFTTSKYYKEVFFPKYNNSNSYELNMAILKKVTKQLKSSLNSNNEIILIDRSINDRQIWNYRRYLKNDIPEKKYHKLRNKYQVLSKELINFLVITYSNSLTSLKRDYNSSLALEKRSFLNLDNLDEYNNNLNALQKLFQESVDDFILIDTSYMNICDTQIEITSKILDCMRKKYLDCFMEKYSLK